MTIRLAINTNDHREYPTKECPKFYLHLIVLPTGFKTG